jgi:dihydrofolate synthase/folylpolyglutamate synthase
LRVSLSLTEWLELLESRHPKAIDLGLDRCQVVWQRLGLPRPANKIFSIAGTNGKGSTVAYLCGMLSGLGYSHGSYTTPHLLIYNERIRINGSCATDEQLVAAFERVEAARGDVSLSYFEFGTLAAIQIMSMERLDFAVMEVGLGGRLDAVNILDPNCTVITPIGLDHQEYLGEDRESIGREKAGIIRQRTPLVCGEGDPPASILAVAANLQAQVWCLGHEFEATAGKDSVHFRKGDSEWILPVPRMGGKHQVDNMATALAALLELVPDAENHRHSVTQGLETVSLPGRMQRVSQRPLVLVDVGHNPMAAAVAAQAVTEAASSRPDQNCLCVIGMLADKDVSAVAGILGPVVSAWYCAGLQGNRGQSGMALASRVRSVLKNGHITACEDVDTALTRALEACRPSDCILVFGSFRTAGAAISRWCNDAGVGA